MAWATLFPAFGAECDPSSLNPKGQPVSLEEIARYYGYGTTPRGLRPAWLVGRYRAAVERALNHPTVFKHFGSYPEIGLAIQMWARANDSFASEILRRFFDRYEKDTGKQLSAEGRKKFAETVLKASRDVDVGKYVGYLGVPSLPLEEVLLSNWTASNTLVDHGDLQVPLFNLRFPQLYAARALLQFGNTYDSANVLEIGYGNPSILKAIQPVFPKANLVGVDVLLVPRAAPGELDGLSLVSGNVPTESAARKQVESKGPYQVIYAVDVFKTGVGFGTTFRPGVSNSEYLKFIASNLKEGGRFIILNDENHPMVFSEGEVKEAGLKIIRKVNRGLTAQERRFSGLSADSPAGNYLVYVIQKGDPDLSHFSVGGI